MTFFESLIFLLKSNFLIYTLNLSSSYVALSHQSEVNLKDFCLAFQQAKNVKNIVFSFKDFNELPINLQHMFIKSMNKNKSDFRIELNFSDSFLAIKSYTYYDNSTLDFEKFKNFALRIKNLSSLDLSHLELPDLNFSQLTRLFSFIEESNSLDSLNLKNTRMDELNRIDYTILGNTVNRKNIICRWDRIDKFYFFKANPLKEIKNLTEYRELDDYQDQGVLINNYIIHKTITEASLNDSCSKDNFNKGQKDFVNQFLSFSKEKESVNIEEASPLKKQKTCK
ncbi:MAG: hypothetical protein JWM09_1052 [Francisellaceae bacterium]|nr:hypothetical protein [Francisellaceae bacterium]